MFKKNIVIALFILSLATPSISFAQIPTSPRAQKIIARVSPVLKKELAKAGLIYGAPIFIRMFKEEKELELWVKNKKSFSLFKKYPICTFGSGGLGPKVKQGDGKTPEGFYYVKPASLNPVSDFHLSFDLGYPNEYDQAHNRTGSALMVHGNCVSLGCFAMTDAGIEEVYTLVDAALRNGQRFFRVHIFPFEMTNENMEKHKGSTWHSFWLNLKEGYNYFKNNGNIPPNVEVKKGRYIFNNR